MRTAILGIALIGLIGAPAQAAEMTQAGKKPNILQRIGNNNAVRGARIVIGDVGAKIGSAINKNITQPLSQLAIAKKFAVAKARVSAFTTAHPKLTSRVKTAATFGAGLAAAHLGLDAMAGDLVVQQGSNLLQTVQQVGQFIGAHAGEIALTFGGGMAGGATVLGVQELSKRGAQAKVDQTAAAASSLQAQK